MRYHLGESLVNVCTVLEVLSLLMMKFVLAYHQLLLTILSERMFNNS